MKKLGKCKKKYCSCGHREEAHSFCECPECGMEHCEYGCRCELRDKGKDRK